MRKPWVWSAALSLTALLALGVMAPAQAAGRGWLGVTMQSMNDGLRDGIGFDGEGVLVNGVESGSPADRAGIRRGDVITSFNSRTVQGQSELSELVANSEAGQFVSIGLWRHGERMKVSVRLATRSDDDEDNGTTRRRTYSDSNDGDDDEDTPTPPMPPMAPMTPMPPMPPMAPMAPHAPRAMMWNDRDMANFGRMFGRGRLGVTIEDLDGETDDENGGRGVRISSVTDDTPASRAGFRTGDVIVRVGDRDIDDSDELRRVLRERPAGRVDIVVLRHGSRTTLTPELGDRERAFGENGDTPGKGWTKSGPGEWKFTGPNGEKRIIINRSDDDSDRMRERRRIVMKHPDRDDDESGDIGRGDVRDRAQLEREIADLKRQIDELQRELEQRNR